MDLKQSRFVQMLAYGYIVAPILLFFVFWSKPVWAIIGGLIIIISFVQCMREPWEEKPLKLDAKFALLIVLIAVIVHFSGIGGFAYQNSDLPYRNRIFLLLINEPWPVSISSVMDGVSQQRGLIYYIGFWLPAALVGKLTKSVLAAFVAMSIWTGLGLFLTWYLLCRYRKQFQIRTLIRFLLFGGLDIIGVLIMGRPDSLLSFGHIEWWSVCFQYSSFMTQLFWVFNQAIYAWILTLMVLLEKRNNHLVFIFSCSLLSCTLPAVGILPFLIYKIICNMETLPHIGRKEMKELFSFENVVGGGFVGILSFLYLFGNDSARVNSIDGVTLPLYWLVYLVFVVLEILVYFWLVYQKEKKMLFFVTLGTLLVCPLIRVGYSADFCMRASIPALVVLFLFVEETLQRYKCQGKRQKYTLLLIIWILGSTSSIQELGRGIWKTWLPVFNTNIENSIAEEVIVNGGNFSGNIEDNIYYSFFANVD